MEDLKFISLVLLSIIIFGTGITLSVNFLAKKSCLDSYSQYKPEYSLFTACRIEWNGKLTPVDMVKNITVEK